MTKGYKKPAKTKSVHRQTFLLKHTTLFVISLSLQPLDWLKKVFFYLADHLKTVSKLDTNNRKLLSWFLSPLMQQVPTPNNPLIYCVIRGNILVQHAVPLSPLLMPNLPLVPHLVFFHFCSMMLSDAQSNNLSVAKTIPKLFVPIYHII